MLSYRHGFHAGNFADVFKHALLCLIAQALSKKDKPLFYLETHAGAGRYDLNSAMAGKNREFAGGIGRLWNAEAPPPALESFLAAVHAANHGSRLRFYPGSPGFLRHFLREQDRMVLCELHATDAGHLKGEFAGDRRIRVYQDDGYQALKSQLPPPERRGLVVLDPPYERKQERQQVVDAVAAAWRRWATGHYAVWYPIQARPERDWFHRQFARSGIGRIFVSELRLYDEDLPKRLNGSGMLLINPPWQLDAQLASFGPWLWQVLSAGAGGDYRQSWLVPE